MRGRHGGGVVNGRGNCMESCRSKTRQEEVSLGLGLGFWRQTRSWWAEMKWQREEQEVKNTSGPKENPFPQIPKSMRDKWLSVMPISTRKHMLASRIPQCHK